MRISMWILAAWLSNYEPVVQIRQGERVLQNARLFSDDLQLSRSTVYLEQTQSDRVLCSNGHDYLILRAEDLNEVFNDILDAFDYYNEWADGAHDLIDGGCSARELLEHGAGMLRRALILADAGFYMREVVDPAGTIPSLPSRGILKDRLLPHGVLLELSRREDIRSPGLASYRLELPGIQPAAAVTNLFSGRMHKGWLITLNEDGVYDRCALDLQDAFCETLTAWMTRTDQRCEYMDRSGVFFELLERPDSAEVRADDRLQTFGWYPLDRKVVYVIRQVDADKDPMHALEHYLEQLNPYAFLLRYGDGLLYIVNLNLTPEEGFAPEFARILRLCGSLAGKSPVFTGFSDFGESYRYALTAVRCAPGTAGGVHGFEETALPYISGLLKQHSAVDLRHPALNALRAYDAAHEAQLQRTLYIFLKNNCSYAETAAELYIHRSTLLYRLQRIGELTGLALEDADVRLRLQISFLIENFGARSDAL